MHEDVLQIKQQVGMFRKCQITIFDYFACYYNTFKIICGGGLERVNEGEKGTRNTSNNKDLKQKNLYMYDFLLGPRK